MIWTSLAKIFNTSRDSVALAQDEKIEPTITLSGMNITFTNEQGKQAVIDFSRDAVQYSGDLPSDMSARLFFEKLGQCLKQ